MAKRKKQYYVVVQGRRPGVYHQWFGEEGAAEQVEGSPEAIFQQWTWSPISGIQGYLITALAGT